MNSFTPTWQFCEVWSNYDSFKIDLENYFPWDNEIVDDLQNKIFFSKIFQHFATADIQYDTLNSFKRHFFIDYENCFKQRKFQLKMIEECQNLSADELLILSTTFQNTARNDNTQSPNPLDNELSYVSDQVSSRTHDSKLQNWLYSIEKMVDNRLYEYLNNFSKHFKQIYGDDKYYYTNKKGDK